MQVKVPSRLKFGQINTLDDNDVDSEDDNIDDDDEFDDDDTHRHRKKKSAESFEMSFREALRLYKASLRGKKPFKVRYF